MALLNFSLKTDFSIRGELEISLEYEEPENLFVTVHKAYNIKAGNTLRNTSDAFVKVAISGSKFHHETKVSSPLSGYHIDFHIRDRSLIPFENAQVNLAFHPSEIGIINTSMLRQSEGNEWCSPLPPEVAIGHPHIFI